jgi:hypothetical protein
MGKLGRLGLEPAQRYEHARPGALVHIDVKKLGRIARPGHRMLGRQSAGGHQRRSYHHGRSSSTSPSTTAPAWSMASALPCCDRRTAA